MFRMFGVLCSAICLLFSALAISLEAKPTGKAPREHYQHSFAVCAIFRNEARFLKEWIEFHKLVGATHFYLYNNLSDDNYGAVLGPYIASGEVEVEDWPFKSQTIAEWTKIQTGAYAHAIQKALGRVKWLAFLDTDEFLYTVQEQKLLNFLKGFEGAGGVVAHWQLFGTSGVSRIPEDKLLIEELVMKAPDGYAENGFVKSIVRPERVLAIDDPHFVHYIPPYVALNQNGHQVPASISPIVVDKLRINHYWSRDEEFFWKTKVGRRQAWLEGLDGQLRRLENINQVEDKTIARFIPELRKKMGL